MTRRTLLQMAGGSLVSLLFGADKVLSAHRWDWNFNHWAQVAVNQIKLGDLFWLEGIDGLHFAADDAIGGCVALA